MPLPNRCRCFLTLARWLCILVSNGRAFRHLQPYGTQCGPSPNRRDSWTRILHLRIIFEIIILSILRYTFTSTSFRVKILTNIAFQSFCLWNMIQFDQWRIADSVQNIWQNFWWTQARLEQEQWKKKINIEHDMTIWITDYIAINNINDVFRDCTW